MQFARYELAIPREHERCPTPRRTRPERVRRAGRPTLAERCRAVVGRLVGRRLRRREARPRLAIHEYLELEFTVEDRHAPGGAGLRRGE